NSANGYGPGGVGRRPVRSRPRRAEPVRRRRQCVRDLRSGKSDRDDLGDRAPDCQAHPRNGSAPGRAGVNRNDPTIFGGNVFAELDGGLARKELLGAAALASSGVILAGCGGSSNSSASASSTAAASKPKRGGTFRLGMSDGNTTNDSLDP